MDFKNLIKSNYERRIPTAIYGTNSRTYILKETIPNIKIVDARQIQDIRSLISVFEFGKYTSVEFETEKIDESKIVSNTSDCLDLDVCEEVSHENEEEGGLSFGFKDGVLVECMKRGIPLCISNIDYNMKILSVLKGVIESKKVITERGSVKAVDGFCIFVTTIKCFKSRCFSFIGPFRFTLEDVLFVCCVKSEEEINCAVKNGQNIVESVEKMEIECNVDGLDFGFSRQKNISKMALDNNFFKNLTNVNILIYLFKEVLKIESSEVLSKKDYTKLVNLLKSTINNRSDLFCMFSLLFLSHLQFDKRNESENNLCEILSVVKQRNIKHLPSCDYVMTSQARIVIQDILLSVKNNIPVLLVGETGTGKTKLVQGISKNSLSLFGFSSELVIVNMSSDSDVQDLVGNYQSVDLSIAIGEIKSEARHFAISDVDGGTEEEYLRSLIRELQTRLRRKTDCKDSTNAVLQQNEDLDEFQVLDFVDEKSKQNIAVKLLNKAKYVYGMMTQKFYFKSGVLTDCIKNGKWILLDEINLASKPLLDFLVSIISKGKMIYLETDEIVVHENFRIFACMNPGNDFGKKDFDSEYFNRIVYDDFSNHLDDIKMVVNNFIMEHSGREAKYNCAGLKDLKEVYGSNCGELFSNYFYELKQLIKSNSVIGNELEPLISGRTLVRFLNALKSHTLKSALKTLFYTQFDNESILVLKKLEEKHFSHILTDIENTKNKIKTRSKCIVCNNNNHINKKQKMQMACTCFSLKTIDEKTKFLVNKRNEEHLESISIGLELDIPVLLQGPTSTGKTSTITYLARLNNKKLFRINNHESTEVSDYIGQYTLGNNNKIEFQEGILLHAMKEGHWILLDELNLAPSEVLEVLNRLLDDNKEIVVEGVVYKAHPNFRLIGTQNLSYSGRKQLSKAFRNRFIEITFDKLDSAGIRDILSSHIKLPTLFVNSMMKVYDGLVCYRSFDCIVTVRDLVRWGRRPLVDLESVYCYGMSLIYERQRRDEDREKVIAVFSNVFKININIWICSTP